MRLSTLLAGEPSGPRTAVGATVAVMVVNPAARGGAGLRRFARVRPHLEERFRLRVVPMDLEGEWRDALRRELGTGVRLVLAGGGDGTVHAVADELAAAGALDEAVLGAVGLGSSNDFHKPFRRVVAGVPLRVDAAGARARDLVVARWERNGVARREVVVVSASIGLAAVAGARFNRGAGTLGVLKRHSTETAIAWSALRVLVENRATACRLSVDGESWAGAIANLSLLETPFLSGSLRYDLPAADDDGTVTVALVEAGGRLRLLGRLAGLYRGRFRDAPRTRHWRAARVVVELREPGPVELDGEIRVARRIRFEVQPRRLWVCG